MSTGSEPTLVNSTHSPGVSAAVLYMNSVIRIRPTHGLNAAAARVLRPGLPIEPEVAATVPSASPTAERTQARALSAPNAAAGTHALTPLVRGPPTVWSP